MVSGVCTHAIRFQARIADSSFIFKLTEGCVNKISHVVYGIKCGAANCSETQVVCGLCCRTRGTGFYRTCQVSYHVTHAWSMLIRQKPEEGRARRPKRRTFYNVYSSKRLISVIVYYNWMNQNIHCHIKKYNFRFSVLSKTVGASYSYSFIIVNVSQAISFPN